VTYIFEKYQKKMKEKSVRLAGIGLDGSVFVVTL
jgi:hypothetical protein